MRYFETSSNWNGIPTGKCVNVTSKEMNSTIGLCEIYAWCPLEVESKYIKIILIVDK
jgi:hypothetical protein